MSFALGMTLAWGFGATAAVPNDFCAGAEEIPRLGPFPHWTQARNITDATTDGDLVIPSCQSDVDNSLWYKFTPAATGIYSFSTCSDAPTATTVGDTVMAIYTSLAACGGPFTEVEQLCGVPGCADDSCGPDGYQAAVTALLQADATYYIVVWRFDDGPPDPVDNLIQLRVVRAELIPIETCQNATPLTLNWPVVGTTFGAKDDYRVGVGACFTNLFDRSSPAAGPDVAYAFTAPSAGLYSFKVFNYANFDPNDLVVYLLASCPAGTPPFTVANCMGAANRNPASSAEEIVGVSLSSNQVVYLIVDDAGCIPGSSFVVEVTRTVPETEPNDTPETAQPLACGVSGSINPSRDVDFYWLGAPVAGSRLFALLDGEAGSRTDFDLRVIASTNTLEYDDDNNDLMFGTKSPNVAGTPLTGEPAYLRVSYKDGSHAGPYRLYAAVQPAAAAAQAEIEPNDSIAQALDAENTSDLGYFLGALHTNGAPADVDVYYFSANAGDLILVSLDCDPWRDNTPFDGRLELLDASGSVLVIADDTASTSSIITVPGSQEATRPFSPAEGLAYRTSDDGTFFVRVSAGRNNSPAPKSGDYLLSLSKNCPICCLPAPHLSLQAGAEPGQWKLVVKGSPGARYELQATSDFSAWPAQDWGTANAEGQCEFTITVEPQSAKFYRAVQVP